MLKSKKTKAPGACAGQVFLEGLVWIAIGAVLFFSILSLLEFQLSAQARLYAEFAKPFR
jgi:hypothetical protein